HEGVLKAPGGLIRAVARINDGHLEDVSLSGDFTMLPATALSILEESLVGSPIGLESVMERLAAVYQSVDIQSPGLEPAHLAEAVHQATG
ncbi:MAG: lipoate--protein ligase family protein, partial [Acidimicrobiia bacterium]